MSKFNYKPNLLSSGEFPTCNKCVYAHHLTPEEMQKHNMSEGIVTCRKKMPLIEIVTGEYKSLFPGIRSDEWCGDGMWFVYYKKGCASFIDIISSGKI